MDKVYRLNLMNSLSGIKPVPLVEPIFKNKVTNLAVISSVMHLSSLPAFLGFMLRPATVPWNTYTNVLLNPPDY